MKILISGSHGLVGSALIPFLTTEGYRVTRLVRSKPKGDEVLWQPDAAPMNFSGLEGFDVVIHLAGESIAGGRWTEERKKKDLRQPRAGDAHHE